jgi:hypothetical protein
VEDQLPYLPFDTGWTRYIYGLAFVSWFIMSQGLCTPYYLFYLWYNNIHGPTMGYIITTIGSITTFIGGSIINAEAAVFNATNYISPIYYTLKLIKNIIPSFHSTP